MANPSDNHAHDGNETTISSLSFDAHHPMLPADITERLAIDEQAGFFFTLIDATADAIIAHRPDGSIIYANGEAVRLLGHEEEADMLRYDLSAGSPAATCRVLLAGSSESSPRNL